MSLSLRNVLNMLDSLHLPEGTLEGGQASFCQMKELAESEPELRPGFPQRCLCVVGWQGEGALLCGKKTQEIGGWGWEVKGTSVQVPLSFREPRRGVASQRSPF